MKRFIKPVYDYIYENFLHSMCGGYQTDLKKELQYVDIRSIF